MKDQDKGVTPAGDITDQEDLRMPEIQGATQDFHTLLAFQSNLMKDRSWSELSGEEQLIIRKKWITFSDNHSHLSEEERWSAQVSAEIIFDQES